MKNLFQFILLTMTTIALGQSNENIIVGNDRDEHGCIGSAGYTWSIVLNDCIRIWELDVQLRPIVKQGNETLTCAVTFAEDLKTAEIFLIEESQSVVLKSDNKKKPNYSGHGYELSKMGTGWKLCKDGKNIYMTGLM